MTKYTKITDIYSVFSCARHVILYKVVWHARLVIIISYTLGIQLILPLLLFLLIWLPRTRFLLPPSCFSSPALSCLKQGVFFTVCKKQLRPFPAAAGTLPPTNPDEEAVWKRNIIFTIWGKFHLRLFAPFSSTQRRGKSIHLLSLYRYSTPARANFFFGRGFDLVSESMCTY